MLQHLGLIAAVRLVAAACLLPGGILGVEAQQVSQQRALVLYVSTPAAPGALAYETIFRNKFDSALGAGLDYHSEFIDLSRFSDPAYSARIADFLRDKYQRLQPDVVIATTGLARQFAESYRPVVFPSAPIVFIDRDALSPRAANTVGINAVIDMAATVDLALTLQPGTRQLFVISGVGAFDRGYARTAREQLARFEGRVAVTYWSTLPFAELQRAVASVPRDSVIFFVSFGEDSTGAKFVSAESGERLGRAAGAPMYSWNEVHMGHDSVGGRMYQHEFAAESAAAVALRILRGEKADDIETVSVDPQVTQLDWRQLKRWNIDESLVPAGATILFREPTLWDRYRLYISGAIALGLLQSALIAGLLVQSRRRRRAEVVMRDNQRMLEHSNRQISELFGRLIAAQETERSRIARDLHDDVSQRIAGLSITMSGLKRTLARNPGDRHVAAALDTMQRDTATLAEEVRHVSHDLHPAALHHTGLVSALGAACTQFETLQGIAVSYRADSDVGIVEPDSALGLYRIAQEALHNVAKHAAARRVDVTLTRSANTLQLSIADDGQGFDPAHPRGLGLVSIDERARLLGGSAEIATHLGRGTLVRVVIPAPSVRLSGF